MNQTQCVAEHPNYPGLRCIGITDHEGDHIAYGERWSAHQTALDANTLAPTERAVDLGHWTDGGDLVPGYADSPDGQADARDQRQADMRGRCDPGRAHALQAKAIGNSWMTK